MLMTRSHAGNGGPQAQTRGEGGPFPKTVQNNGFLSENSRASSWPTENEERVQCSLERDSERFQLSSISGTLRLIWPAIGRDKRASELGYPDLK